MPGGPVPPSPRPQLMRQALSGTQGRADPLTCPMPSKDTPSAGSQMRTRRHREVGRPA